LPPRTPSHLRGPAMTTTLTHWISGKPAAGRSGRFGDVFNPATGEVTARVPLADAAELDAAVASASAALAGWAATPPLRRARVLFKFKESLERNKAAPARATTLDHGNVLSDAEG